MHERPCDNAGTREPPRPSDSAHPVPALDPGAGHCYDPAIINPPNGRPMSKRLENRIALVTGASRGIGAAVAERYAAEGAHVVLVARTVGGLEETDDAIKAAGGSATLVPLDLTDGEKLDTLGPSLYERFGRLDIVVGCAGVLGGLSPLTHYDADVWREVIDVNLNANWRLLRTVDPLLRASDAGRAIFVSSGVTRAPRAYWGPYAVSKAGLEMMVGIYAEEVAKTAVRANLIDPGKVRTRMREQAYPAEDPETLPTPAEVAGHFVEPALPSFDRNSAVIRI